MPFFEGGRPFSNKTLFFISLHTFSLEKKSEVVPFQKFIYPTEKKNFDWTLGKKNLDLFFQTRIKKKIVGPKNDSKKLFEEKNGSKKTLYVTLLPPQPQSENLKQIKIEKNKGKIQKKNPLHFLFFYFHFSVFDKEPVSSDVRFLETPFELFSFLLRTKHKGGTRKDLEIFILAQKKIPMESKRFFFSDNYVQNLWKRGLVQKHKWGCGRVSRERIPCWQTRLHQDFFSLRFFWNKKETTLPPCLHCPVLYECHPQGNINPFDCFHFLFWLKI